MKIKLVIFIINEHFLYFSKSIDDFGFVRVCILPNCLEPKRVKIYNGVNKERYQKTFPNSY